MAEKTILGIDLRVTSVKVVELKSLAGGYTLSSWGMDEISSELLDKHPDFEIAQSNSLKKIISENNIKANEAYVVIGGKDVLVKKISMPKLSTDEIKQAIKWKIKDELGYPAEEAEIDFIPLKEKPGATEQDIVIFVTNRETIKKIADVMALAQLKLVSIVPVPIALKELNKDLLEKNNIASLIYMGRNTTNMSFFKDSDLHINREVPIGGEDITKAMTSVLVSQEGRSELTHEQAEKIKHEHGIPMDIATYPKLPEISAVNLYSLILPALERIQSEISRTIEYFKGQEGDVTIKKIILTGGTSSIPNLMEFLSSALDITFEKLDPFAGIKISPEIKDKDKLSQAASKLSCAIGAAMTSTIKTVNLAPVIPDKWKSFIKKHSNPLEVYFILFMILGLYFLGMTYVASNLTSSINDAEKVLADIKPKLLRIEELEKSMKEEEGRRGIFKSIELSRVKIPMVLEAVSRNVPESILIQNIGFMEVQRKISIKGLSFARGNSAENIISIFLTKLSENPVFETVQLVSVTKASGYIYDAFNFEMTGIIKK